jgi:hypothetical protein
VLDLVKEPRRGEGKLETGKLASLAKAFKFCYEDFATRSLLFAVALGDFMEAL